MLDYGKRFILVKTEFGTPLYYTNSGAWSPAREEARVYRSRQEASNVNATFCDRRINVVETKG